MNPGIHRIPIEDHHKIQPVFSKTLESYMALSPAHAKAFLAEPFEQTKDMAFGAAFHDALLQMDEFAKKYVKAPDLDGRTKEYKEWAKTIPDTKTVIKADDYETILQMVDAVHEHPTAAAFLQKGEPEVTAVAEDQETGAMVKCRPDYLRTDNIIVDLKTTDCAEPKIFCRKSIYKFRYHVQAALYLDTVNAAIGKPQYDTFAIIAVEKERPFGVSVTVIDSTSIDKGRELYRKSLAQFAECLKSDVWPGYPTDAQTSMPPLWALEE